MNLRSSTFDLRSRCADLAATTLDVRAVHASVTSRSQIAIRNSQISRGFSFTELLFAVMILGIGFILIAAVFPVGLSQSKANFDETHSASLARSAAAEIGKIANKSVFGSSVVFPLQLPNSNIFPTSMIAHDNMISPSDPRYAWVGLYRRVPGVANTIQLCLFIVNRPEPFTQSDFVINNNVRPLEPRVVHLDADATTFGIAGIGSSPGDNPLNAGAAAPGAFVIIANAALSDTNGSILTFDNTDTADTPDPEDYTQANNHLAARVVRLGTNIGGTNFDAFPGYELNNERISYIHPTKGKRTVQIVSLNDATAYLVGRNRQPAGGFEGSTMDVAYYTTFIALK